jgi:hypothetical protein
MTLDEILQEMRTRILDNVSVTPASWIDSALMLNVLAEDIDNELAGYEALMAEKRVEYIRKDHSAAASKELAKSDIDYKDYLYLRAKRKRVDDYIMLAKKRAVVKEI